jgi:hypothetical protein
MDKLSPSLVGLFPFTLLSLYSLDPVPPRASTWLDASNFPLVAKELADSKATWEVNLPESDGTISKANHFTVTVRSPALPESNLRSLYDSLYSSLSLVLSVWERSKLSLVGNLVRILRT